MAGIAALRTYAEKVPSEIPASILFSHTDRSLTIVDKYAKSKFHFLVLPRVHKTSPANISDLHSLKSLCKLDKDLAKEVILGLKEDAERMKGEIEKEMMRMYGFVWPVWTGFHAVPSMHHLHVHVISGDLCSDSLKVKKHYNSFHPKLGFFLHIDEVLSWFDAEDSYYNTMIKLEEKKYEPLLKERLSCCHCERELKTMPQLKQHLDEEWEKLAEKEKARGERKRKLDERREHKKIEEAAEDQKEDTKPTEAADEQNQDEEGAASKKVKIDNE